MRVVRYPGIRFLFVSGYTPGAADRLRGPAADFLAKPFSMDALCHAVRNLLMRQPAVRH